MFKDLYLYCALVMAVLPVILAGEKYKTIIVDLLNQQPGNSTLTLNVLKDTKNPIVVQNINTNVSFFVIQVHSYIENLTLSYTSTIKTNLHANGTNTGLVWQRTMEENKSSEEGMARFFLFRPNPLFKTAKVLLAVTTYSEGDPIPGGCNLSFETMIAPYQKISYTDDIITVMSQPPSQHGEFCKKDNITTTMYHLYLKEYSNDTDEYFSGIQKMLTVESILEYGTKVPSGLGHTKFKQMYNLYRGTGRVFAVVSTNTLNGQSASYIPAVSFGCNLMNWNEECVGPVGTHWKWICAILVIAGGFICFGGHRFFKTGLFTMGFTFGSIVTLVAIDDYFSTEVNLFFMLSAGILSGLLWVLLWWFYGAPLVSVQLTFLLAGTLIASIVLYNDLGDLIIFSDDLFFWLVFCIIVLITLMPIFPYPSVYHIIALSFLGSYAFVVAMNYYLGGNLPYILINTYRRIAVKNFRFVVLDPPYQMLDLSQTILWAILFGLGVFVQYRHSVGKAPFPPHRFGGHVIHTNNERTPLIEPETPASTHGTFYNSGPLDNANAPIMYSERVPPPPYHQ